MRKEDAKLGNKIDRLRCREKRFAQTRKRVTRSIDRRGLHVTVRTDPGSRSLAREELLSMAVQTRRMFGKLSHIRKSVAFADFFPVPGGKLVTRVTREFLFSNVSGMRKAGVLRAGLRNYAWHQKRY